MSDPLWLPNLIKPATGTDVSGKRSLDVYVSGGVLSFTEDATAADGAALPALTKVIAGYDGAAVQVIKTDSDGELQVDVLSSALPSGAATEVTLGSALTELTNILNKMPFVGQAFSADSWPVVIASDQSAIGVNQSGPWTVTTNEAGFTKANAPVRNDYTSVNVTTGAYVELVASTTSATKEVSIFDSSGQTLVLAIGAAASEVDQMLVFPGGNGREKWSIPAGSRVSIKAVSATAAVGEISINFWG